MTEELLVNDLQNGEALLNILGSFWNRLYGDTEFVGYITDSRAMSERQTFRDLMEYVASVSRFTIPLYHRDNWRLLTFKASEVEGSGTEFVVSTDSLENFVGVRSVMNRIVQPSVVWTDQIDFYINNDKELVFLTDPGSDTRFNRRPIYEFGVIVDYEVDMWLFNADFDFGYVYEQFGYVLAVHLSTSENYKKLVNSIFDAIILGTARQQIETMMAAIADVPLVIEPQETIEKIYSDRTHLVIVTDKNVYKNNLNAKPLVAVGDIVRAGNFLTDAVEVSEFGINFPTNSAISAVSLGTGMLYPFGTYGGVLKWRNATVPTTVTLNVSGKTKIEWELGGESSDVNTFWSSVHTNGVTTGTTLANLMDTRTNKVGEPSASNLPATINPFVWLSDNVLKYNTFGIVVRTESVGPNNLGISDPSSFLRKIVPPNIGVIYQTLTSYLKEYELRSILQAQVTLTYSVASIIGQYVLSYTANSLLKGTITKTYTTDAIIGQPTKSYGVNAIIKGSSTKTYDVTAILS